MDHTLHVGILAGEASGDLLGAGLMQALRERVPGVTFSGIGGPGMIARGLNSMVSMDRLSVMGLTEPLKRLPELMRIRGRVYRHMQASRPDVFIGIDSPDFNLGLEKKIRALGIPTVHYVCPSVWAWRQGRVNKIRKAVDLVLSLFPFEEQFLRKHDIDAYFVGHPLADILPMNPDTAKVRNELGMPEDARMLAILPGSREGEVGRLCPVFLAAFELCRQQIPDLHAVIPCGGSQRRQQVEKFLAYYGDVSGITLVDGQSRTVMAAADAVLMASGTATLEALLLKKPMVVAYKMAPLSYAVISRMLKSPYISLPNLLAGKQLVPELLQDEVTPQRLAAEIVSQLHAKSGTDEIVKTFHTIHTQLKRDASVTAADAVLKLCSP
jgi:lipid-A-disaccharide synthase